MQDSFCSLPLFKSASSLSSCRQMRAPHLHFVVRHSSGGCLNSPSLSDPCWRVRRKFCKPANFWFSLLVFTAVAGPPYRSTNPKSCQAKARKTKTTNSRNQTRQKQVFWPATHEVPWWVFANQPNQNLPAQSSDYFPSLIESKQVFDACSPEQCSLPG